MTRRHKYNARKITLYGYTFDSQDEGNRYLQLRSMQEAGEISDLELQPRFVLVDGGVDWRGRKVNPIRYVADFQYTENGRTVVEDVKGYETPVFRIKEKLFLLRYPNIVFRKTRKGQVVE